MSAFIISNETMNRIINGLYELKYLKPSTDKNYIKLANKLYQLNREAILQRYEKDDDYAKPPEFVWEKQSVKAIDAVKAMHCLRYQCAEGDVPKKSLYRWLSRTIHYYQAKIVIELQEYEDAKWD
jgi:hypothetical protein